jgi:hypothetical protein
VCQIDTLDGTQSTGVLVLLDSDRVVLSTEHGPVTWAPNQLQAVTAKPVAGDEPPSPRPNVLVELTDGTLLNATAYQVANGRATIELVTGDELQVTTRSVHTVRFKTSGPYLEQQWRAIVARTAAGDLIVIRKTLEAAGSEEARGESAVLDQVEGTLGDIGEERVSFIFDGAERDAAKAKIEGLIYHQVHGRRLPDAICEVVDRGGSSWIVRSLVLEDRALSLTTLAGVRWRVPLDQLDRVDFSVGNLEFLESLTVESSEYQPHFHSSITPTAVSRWFRPRAGETSYLSAPSKPEETCDHRLALHSRTKLTYRLQKEYSRLRATAAIDSRFRDEGQVRFVIEGDNRTLFDREISGSDGQVPLDVEILGVRRLAILVDFGSDGNDRGDHLNLCNARLIK